MEQIKKIISLMEEKNDEKFSDFSSTLKTLVGDLQKEILLTQDEVIRIKKSIKDDNLDELESAISDLSKKINSIDTTPVEKTPSEIVVKIDDSTLSRMKGEKGDKGDKGETGKKGDDGYTPVKGVDYFDGENGSPDTPEQIVEKINTLENVIDIKTIKDFPKIESTTEIKRQMDTIGNQVLRLLSKPAVTTTGGGGGGTWGSITGTLSDQTDLQSALDAKVPYTGATANVDLGTYDLITDTITAKSSAGTILENASGGDVLHIGNGGGVNATAYGGWNFDAATADTIAIFGASKTLSSASTSTYPNLTELSYLKGVTSSLQTQFASYLPLTGATYTTTTGNGLALTTSTLTTGNLVSLASTGTAAASNTQTVLNLATSGANGTSTQTTYGLYSTNTHTGTASTNVAGYFSASGGTNNYGLIVANGRVGIGTTTPNQTLSVFSAGISTVEGGAANDSNLLIKYNTDGSASSALEFGYGSSGSYMGSRIVSSIVNGGGADLKLQTATNGAGTYTTKLTILRDGNIGVGTTAPGSKFTVSDTNRTIGTLASDVNTAIHTSTIINIDVGATLGLGGAINTGGGTNNFGVIAGRKTNATNANTSGYLSFSTNLNGTGMTEKMRILDTGLVGIGLTAPTAVLHLKAGTATANTAPFKFTSGTNLTTAEAGVMEYDNTFHLTNSDATRRHVVTAPNTTKVTAAAPYTNDGYIIINIGGTDFKVMTTA